MKSRLMSLGMLIFILSVLLVQSGIAATVDGHAYKDGQTDHSGITIDLEPLPSIPSIGVTGLLLLLAGITLFLSRKHTHRVVIPMLICLVAGFCCIGYAGYLATTQTNTAGEYSFTDMEPGDYSIDASAPGYYPEHIGSFTVIEGANTPPEITLYPMGTPTPSATALLTQTPTSTPTQTPTNTSIPAGYLISIDTIVGNMRHVPAGTFTQGSPETEACRLIGETQFTHILTRDLAVMETEVTRQMWSDLLLVQPSLPGDPTHVTFSPSMIHPVQQNTWYEAVLFANLLSVQNGYTPCYYRDSGFTDVVDSGDYINDDHSCDFDSNGYRLATEGEWEYFCRAGTVGAFSCNETNYTSGTCGSPYCQSGEFPILEQHAVFCSNASTISEPVGSFLSNPWNLKDLHGNVMEWCWDWVGIYPVGPESDYAGVGSSSNRVLRSGGWDDWAKYCRSAQRFGGPPGYRSFYQGFRLLRSTN
ncbi:SUMF1/EgtB/PvdO family nonheme iron enzyme [bacterium]|nr:SUMF1/EgtB/PvdO family nonheme iron enzyme [candidate division CSSED10-310 bacterium]